MKFLDLMLLIVLPTDDADQYLANEQLLAEESPHNKNYSAYLLKQRKSYTKYHYKIAYKTKIFKYIMKTMTV